MPLDPRIKHVVAEIDDNVDQDHEHGDHEHGGLYLRIVAMVDGVEHQLANTGQTEYLLDHDSAGDEVSGGDTDRGHHRQEGIAKPVPDQHAHAASALGARRRHV